MMKKSDYEDSDDPFEEILALAERLLQEPLGMPRREPRPGLHPVERNEPDEVIVGPREVAYLLQAPGYGPEDFTVSVYDESLDVKTKDFVRSKMLGSRVRRESAAVDYRNGVLSVRMERVDV